MVVIIIYLFFTNRHTLYSMANAYLHQGLLDYDLVLFTKQAQKEGGFFKRCYGPVYNQNQTECISAADKLYLPIMIEP